MKDRTAIVTGSTSGIGLAVARTLAARGARIVVNGLGRGEGERIAEEIAQVHGVPAAFIGADMSRPDEVSALVEEANDRFGSVDILVNNAGVQHTSPVETFEAHWWDTVIAVNLSSNFHAIRAALPLMRVQGWGRIVNIASAHGLVASVNKAAYVAAKHGVVGLTKVVALETATSPITCNAVCPGWVLTPLVERQIEDIAARDRLSMAEARQRLLFEKQPSGTFVTPEQIGETVAFLCSNAAAEIRGVALPVDGGWTAR